MRVTSAIFAAIAAIIGLTIIFGSWYTVDQTERGVLLRNGALAGIAEPGLHFKTPWIESVVKVGNFQRASRWTNGPNGDFRQEAYSQDQQPAHLTISVLWHIPAGSSGDLYQSYLSPEGAESNLLNRRVPQDIKTEFGQFTAVSAIQERVKLNSRVLAAVQNDPDIKNSPIVIDGVQIEDIAFSTDYIKSVEQRMQAEVEVQRMQQQALQAKVQAQITVTQAQAAADAVVARAKADADATRLRGDAEGAAIKAKGDALRENPALVSLTTAEKWNGVLPQVVPPNGAVPFLDLNRGR